MATRYRRDKQKLQIEGQTIQWPQNTDEINRSNKSKVRQYNGHKIPTRSTEATNRGSENTMPTRYRRDKQNLQIEGQTIQWPKDTDEINRIYKSKVRQYNGHKIPKR
jgi:Zn/Cd-binding protein ZinT